MTRIVYILRAGKERREFRRAADAMAQATRWHGEGRVVRFSARAAKSAKEANDGS
ncbi:MAG TPA: hypothetical protein VM238_18610 [Phycisphaerae bacterium]|nr:hypothetical protein [Phycisphaerae bacterium]